MKLSNLLKSGSEAVPGVEWFGNLPDRGRQMRAANLPDVVLDDAGNPVPHEDDAEVGRWIGGGGLMVTVGPDGQPIRTAINEGESRGSLIPLVQNGGVSLYATTTRLVGSFISGSLGGNRPIGKQEALAFTYFYDDIDYLTAQTRTTLFGNQKDDGLMIGTAPNPAAAGLVVDIFDEIDYSSRRASKVKDQMVVAEQIVKLIAAHRGMPTPRLQPDGEGDLTAEFTTDGEG